jgi:hypothetical protein
MELDTYLEIAIQLGYLRVQSVEPAQQMTDEISRMRTMLTRSLRRQRPNPQ